ncbi:MAG: OsmC family protein, partial [Oleibacter sp.]|nr:OsmC family protein [Thalassolituus sp.]
MKATVKWVGGAMYLGESGSGHTVVMDGPEDHGGRNMGVRPMEMLLLGLGGCTSFDVMSILRKQRLDVIDCVAEIDAERADAV